MTSPASTNAPSLLPASFLEEKLRQTRVAGSYDVVVCGGGPAGIAAAILAARGGARTRLIELHGCLGGVWTSGLLSYVIDADKPGGFLAELKERLAARGAFRKRNGENFIYDPEQMKLLLEELCLEVGVSVQLHTRITDAVVDENRRIRSVITESKSGRQAWSADIFIDCTGDGDLAALAGNRFSVGHPATGEVQPMSLIALITGIDPVDVHRFNDVANPNRKSDFLAEIRKGGGNPSYSAPTLFHIFDNLFALMATHEYLVPADDAQAITDATIRARANIDQTVRALRSNGGIWKSLRTVISADQIGVREGRRILGRASVTENDLAEGRRFSDSVCRAAFGMDVHSPNPAVSKDFDFRERRTVLPYDIPYGAIVAADVDGLMMAGRCISGDFLAHSSYRVTGNSVTLGESAGIAAALCIKAGLLPHQLQWSGRC